MKNFSFLVMTIVLFGGVFCAPKVLAQNVSSQNADSETAVINSAMRFEIALDRPEYLQLEPVGVKCGFSNETDKPITTLIPSFLNESRLEVNSGGESRQFNSLSIFSGLLRRSPVTFAPGTSAEENITLEKGLDEIFPAPGTYTIRLALPGSEGNLIWSNPVKITILEPAGIDKEAFNFIQRNKSHRRYPVLFLWNDDIKNEAGQTLLEEFVSKYSASIYGESAIYQLGNYYFRRNEYEKARTELKKLKFSRNPRIAKQASDTLSDVEKSMSKQEKPQ